MQIVDKYGNEAKIDPATQALYTVDYPHGEKHEGNYFYVINSVVSLGAMTTPDDAITITFKTPDTDKWGHMIISAEGTAGWLFKIVEAYTGGAASATGTLSCVNFNRNSTNVSVMSNGTTAGVMNYDATLATGGTTLVSKYLTGNTIGISASSGTETRGEIILKKNTNYQVSLYGTDTNPATIELEWYEHTNVR